MSEALDVVEKLNIELFEKGHEDGFLFDYLSDGFVESIEFCKNRIWDSDSDEREWLDLYEEYETLEGFVRKKIKVMSAELALIAEDMGE